jgi:hypothetical protein
MDVVLGDAPAAVALARALGTSGPTVLAGCGQVEGPFLWRKGALASGEGVAAAVKGADRLVVVVEAGQEVGGLFTAIKAGLVGRAVVVLPHGVEAPAGLRKFGDWAILRVGPVWGPEEPLVAAWARAIVAGRSLWVANPGPMRPVAEADLLPAVLAVLQRPGARWSLVGEAAVGLPDLAAALAAGLERPLRAWRVPVGLAARQAGVEARRWQAWIAASSGGATNTDDWQRPTSVGSAGWLGVRARWERVEVGSGAADG